MTISATTITTLAGKPEELLTGDHTGSTDARPRQDEAVVIDDLVEDVSIDGMCGVY
ncbi:mycofactocin precursor MftA [Intrasporangium sp.]|uniref:mycofactocin precursor MftA n=1 Tax=Intrasporangium sp. TaxID=1925024 RepID=UPI00322160BC